MKDGKDDCDYCAPRVPLEWYRMNSSAVQDGDCRGKEEEQDCDNPQVHDQRFAENGGVGDLLEHGSLHDSNSSVQSRVDHIRIIIHTGFCESPAPALSRGDELRCLDIPELYAMCRIMLLIRRIYINPADLRTDFYCQISGRKRIASNSNRVIRNR